MKARTWIGVALSLVSTLAFSAAPTLTQSVSQTPVPGSVSCNNGGAHADNSYWRAYDLAPLNLAAPLVISSVQFGIEQAISGTGTTQPVTVNVYTSAGPFPGSALTLRASQPVLVPNQNLTRFDVTLTTPTPPLPVNSIVVVELHTPDGQAAGHSFFIGSNSLGQTGPSYISAAACGVPNPVDLASLGFPGVHIILNANSSHTLAENLACGSNGINALMQPAIIGPAQKNLLINMLGLVNQYKDTPYRSLASGALNSVLIRLDGCALRTTPDTVLTQGGAGMDFLTTCQAQAPIYACLKAAQTQLTAP